VADVFNSLSSLIWLVIVLLIIAAVVAVVKAMFAPRGGEPYTEPRVVEQPVAQQPMATSGLAPGWYPDQNDQTLMRFFDGQVWTSRTQPRN
jgi:hypothetical protein